MFTIGRFANISKSKLYFLLGLIFFYLVIFLFSNKLVHFSAFFISTFFFYLSTKDLPLSLVFSLVLSFFFEVGLAGSLFLKQPDFLDLGSGYMITPFTMLIILLFPFSIVKRIAKINFIDVLVFLFFLWNVVNLLIFHNLNIFYGILSLAEVILGYFILRTYLSKKNISFVSPIIVSVLVFQSIVSVFQYLLSRPLGLMIEGSLYYTPFGIRATENQDIFRVSGSFGHANMLAVVIISLLPFLFTYKGNGFTLLMLTSYLTLFLTFTRVAWLMGLFLFVYYSVRAYFLGDFYLKKRITILGMMILFSLLFIPNIFGRLSSTSEAFAESGSMGTRVKLIKEALNMITQYPLTGVGINRFQDLSSEEQVTDVFRRTRFSSATLVHNLFIEQAVEIGIPGVLFFCLILVSASLYYWREIKKRKNLLGNGITLVKKASFIGMIGLIYMASFNPFFQTSQFKIFFLLLSLILV